MSVTTWTGNSKYMCKALTRMYHIHGEKRLRKTEAKCDIYGTRVSDGDTSLGWITNITRCGECCIEGFTQ